MKPCRHCRQPIATSDCADPHVMHPVHIDCLAEMRAMPRPKPTPDTPLGKRTRELLPRRVR